MPQTLSFILAFLLFFNSTAPALWALGDIVEEGKNEQENVLEIPLEEKNDDEEIEEILEVETKEENETEVEKEEEIEEEKEEVTEVQEEEQKEEVETQEEVIVEEIVEEEVVEVETWVVNGNMATTSLPVTLGTKYVAPQDEDVSVTFTKLPDVSSTLSIEKIFLTDEEVKKTNAVSNIAFDITTDMVNGTFEYDLTLPFVDGDIKVGFVEERDGLKNGVEELKNFERNEKIEIKGLDHFTVFVIIVDDEDDDFEHNGWNNHASGYNGSHKWVQPTQIGKVATWKFDGEDGKYAILPSWVIWNTQATNARYQSEDIADFDVTVNQKNVGNSSVTSTNNGTWSGWKVTDIYDLEQGDEVYLAVEDVTDGNLAADAMAFVSMKKIYVDNNWISKIEGEDLGNDRIFGVNAFSTIQEGIENVMEGGTINIAAGIYEENILINKANITLQGQSKDEVIIAPTAIDIGDCMNSTDGSPQFGIVVVSDNVNIKDLTVDGSEGTFPGGFRISITNYDPYTPTSYGDYLVIDNVNVFNSLRRGIAYWPYETTGHVISHSNISNIQCQQGIFSAAKEITVIENTISNAGMAIGLYPNVQTPSTITSTITNNIIYNIAGSFSTYYGHSWPSVAIYYRNPNVDQTLIVDNNNITIGNGTEELTWGVTGMYIYNTDENSLIQGNIINSENGDNNTGIYLGGCAGTKVKNNELTMNGTDRGIFLGRGSSANPIPNIVKNNDLKSTNSTILNPTVPERDSYGIAQANYAAGLFFLNENPYNTNNIITKNNITGFQRGILFLSDGGTNNIDATINYNNIHKNLLFGFDASTLTNTVNATYNWWGHLTGPSGQGNGHGDSVSINVTYQEWLCEPYHTDWESVNGVCKLETPEVLGFNVSSLAQNPGDTPVALQCGSYTNDNTPSQVWTSINLDGVRYQRQAKPPGGSWWTDPTTYTNTHNEFGHFGQGWEGKWEVRVRAFYDTNGNGQYDSGEPVSDWSNECSIIYDATPPTIPELTYPTQGQYIKSSELYLTWEESSDNFTNPEDIVYKYRYYSKNPIENPNASFVEATYTGTTRHPASGFASGTGEGVFWWTVQAIDLAGNKSEIAPFRMATVDDTAPTSTVSILGNHHEWKNRTLNNSWKGLQWFKDFVEVVLELQGENNDFINYAIIEGQENCSEANYSVYQGNLANEINSEEDGIYKLCFYAEDLAGNIEQPTNEQLLKLDSTRGTSDIVLVSGNYVNGIFYTQSPVQIIAELVDAESGIARTRLYVTDKSINTNVKSVIDDTIVDAGITHTHESSFNDLPDGEYYVRVMGYDKAQNHTNTTRADFVVDNTNPEGTIDYLYYSSRDVEVQHFKTNDNTPTLGGTCSDNFGLQTVTLEVNGDTQIIDCNNDLWRSNPVDTLPNDVHLATLTLVDLAGNETTVTQNITIDTVTPTAVHTYYKNGIEITEPIAYVQNVDELTFTGVYEDADPSSGLQRDVFVVFRNHDLKAYCGWNQFLIGGGVHLNGESQQDLTIPQNISECVDTLENGKYHIRHRIYDNATRATAPAYNQHRQYTGLQFIVDNVAPQTTMTDISNTYHNSPISLQGITEDQNNVDYVEIHVSTAGENNWELLTTLNNGHNTPIFNWSYLWTPDEEGTYDIYTSGADLAGNIERTAIVYSVTYDTTPPDISWEEPLEGSIHNSSISLKASTNETMNNVRFRWRLQGEADWNTGVNYNNQDQYYEHTFDPAEDGIYEVRVQGRDLALNWSRAIPDLTIVVDRTRPNLTITSPSNDDHISGAFQVAGIASDATSGIQDIRVVFRNESDDKLVETCWATYNETQNTYSLDVNSQDEQCTVPEGHYLIRVRARDNAGNNRFLAVRRITIDNTAPTTEITSPSEGHVSNQNPLIEGVTTDNFSVKKVLLSYAPYVEGECGTWQELAEVENPAPHSSPYNWDWLWDNIEEGTYCIKAQGVDLAGNIEKTAIVENITFDETPPTSEITSPSENYITNSKIQIKGETLDTLSGTKEVLLSYAEYEKGVCGKYSDIEKLTKSFDSWTHTWTPPAEGIYCIRAQGVDLAGNVENTSVVKGIVYDITKPVATFSIVNGILNITKEDALSGIKSVQVKVGDGKYIDYTAGMDLKTLVGNIPGTYPVTIRVVDNAGNPYTGTGSFTIAQPPKDDVDETDEDVEEETIIVVPTPTPTTTTTPAVLGATTTTQTATQPQPLTQPGTVLGAVAPIPQAVEEEGEILAASTEEADEGEVLGEAAQLPTCEEKLLFSGYAFLDKNKNGKMDEKEKGIENIAIQIYYVTEEGKEIIVETLKTNEDGFWSIELCPGTYIVKIVEDDIFEKYSFDGDLEQKINLSQDKTLMFPLQLTRSFWRTILPWIFGILVIATPLVYVLSKRKKY